MQPLKRTYSVYNNGTKEQKPLLEKRKITPGGFGYVELDLKLRIRSLEQDMESMKETL